MVINCAAVNQDQAMKEKYPGVELAYDLAVDSYDAVIKRIDVMNGRLQTMIAFATTTTAVVPTVANARGLTFRSWFFYLAISVFGLIILIGTTEQLRGTIKMLNPDLFFEKWLDLSEWEFKKDFIAFAGESFDHNKKLLDRKWRASVYVTVLFVLEVVFLVAWVGAAALRR